MPSRQGRHAIFRAPLRQRLHLPAAAVLGLAACDPEVPPRPQLVVYVDTDAPAFEQARADTALSRDAAVDTVRIDVFDAQGVIFDHQLVHAERAADWPVSFGVAGGGAGVRLRVRVFRADLAAPARDHGFDPLAPPVEIALDRLIDLAPVGASSASVLVTIASDCRGIPASFLEPETTCVDASDQRGAPAAGVTKVASPPSSSVGTWQRAREVPCEGTAPPGAACVAGGFGILGDARAVGVGKDDPLSSSPIPPRAVYLAPFWMDRTEFTVGRLRALLAAGHAVSPLPVARDASTFSDRYCTFLGAGDPTNDDYPLSCVLHDVAQTLCELEGGSLPSEAQWDFAARGRGEGRIYPWGDEEPTCCATSFGRRSDPTELALCKGTGPEPVGSHASPDGCAGLSDTSRDGVLDLGGSLGELLLDDIEPLDGPHWALPGILLEPLCQNDSGSPSTRGGSWSGGFESTVAAARRGGVRDFSTGFRCVYPDAPPAP
jgi:formylglycine-generating enzyme required for sulfatase activity